METKEKFERKTLATCGDYEIRIGVDGMLYCTCPAWRFSKKRGKNKQFRNCKHLDEYFEKMTIPNPYNEFDLP